MLYRLYTANDTLMRDAGSVEEALQEFGKEYDDVVNIYGKVKADNMKVKVFIDKGKGNKAKFAEYYISEFLNKDPKALTGLGKIAEKDGKEIFPGECKNDDFMEFRERAKNFDEAEQKEALLYMPTGFLLGELARRLEEYDTAAAGIAGIIDNMKIYHKE